MFQVTIFGRFVAIVTALVGTIINSMITASIINMLSMNSAEENCLEVGNRIMDRSSQKQIMMQYVVYCSKVKIARLNFNQAKISNEKLEETRAVYYEAVRAKLSWKKKVRQTIQ